MTILNATGRVPRPTAVLDIHAAVKLMAEEFSFVCQKSDNRGAKR